MLKHSINVYYLLVSTEEKLSASLQGAEMCLSLPRKDVMCIKLKFTKHGAEPSRQSKEHARSHGGRQQHAHRPVKSFMLLTIRVQRVAGTGAGQYS